MSDLIVVQVQSVAVTREGLSLGEDNEEMGWVKEPNGPNSAYWRRIKRLNKSHSPKSLLKTSGTKPVDQFHFMSVDA